MLAKISRLTLIFLLSITLFSLVGCDNASKTVKVYFQWDTIANVITKEVKIGDKVTPPTDISKEGYEVEHWYLLGKSDDQKFNFDTEVIQKSITLVALWKETTPQVTKYSVIFNSQGGSIVPPITGVLKGELIDEPDEPTKEDYIFAGWYKEPACANQWNFLIDTVSAATTLYAKWTAAPTVFYDITFYGLDDQVIKTISVGKGFGITDLTDEEKELTGYTFRRWTSDIDRKNTYYLTTPTKANVSLYAVYYEENKLDYSDYNGYYSNIDLETTTYGPAIKSKLHTRLNNGFNNITYGDVRYALCTTDSLLNDSTKVRSIYDGVIYNAIWDGGTTWNREHVWCQSHLPVEADNGSANIASDLHNLTACDQGTNSARSNRYYDNCTKPSCSGRLKDGTHPYGCSGDPYYYFPGDLYKGDIARILMYMDTMYSELTLTNKTYYISSKELEFSMLDVLVEWSEEDPVDEFEMHRNEMIYKNTSNNNYSQNNRNPYIDYPELARIIYDNNSVAPRTRKSAKDIYFEYTYTPEYYDINLGKKEYTI